MISWWIASLISNAAIIAVEWLNTHSTAGWGATLLRTGPLIIIAQWGLFTAYKGAPGWMQAWMMFTIGNSIMRVGAISVLGAGQISSWGHVLSGVSVMLGGALLLKQGLR